MGEEKSNSPQKSSVCNFVQNKSHMPLNLGLLGHLTLTSMNQVSNGQLPPEWYAVNDPKHGTTTLSIPHPTVVHAIAFCN